MTYLTDIAFSSAVIPPGYFRVPEVFEAIGRHYYGATNDWTGDEAIYEELVFKLPSADLVFEPESDNPANMPLFTWGSKIVRRVLRIDNASAPIQRTHWLEAQSVGKRWTSEKDDLNDRQLQIYWIMYRLGMNGGLGYCFLNSESQIRELDKFEWHVVWDVACDRFEHGALNTHPLYTKSRPAPFRDGSGYFEHFKIPLFVQKDNLRVILQKLPIFDPTAAGDSSSIAHDMVSRFMETLTPEHVARPTHAPVPKATKPEVDSVLDFDHALAKWEIGRAHV